MKFNFTIILLNIVLALGGYVMHQFYERFVALEQENREYDDKLEHMALGVQHLVDKVEFLEEELKLKVLGGKE